MMMMMTMVMVMMTVCNLMMAVLDIKEIQPTPVKNPQGSIRNIVKIQMQMYEKANEAVLQKN